MTIKIYCLFSGSTFKDVKTGTSPRMDKNQPVDKNLETWDKASWSGYEHDDKYVYLLSKLLGLDMNMMTSMYISYPNFLAWI